MAENHSNTLLDKSKLNNDIETFIMHYLTNIKTEESDFDNISYALNRVTMDAEIRQLLI